MGTPDFAVKPLQALHQAGYEIVGVFTQPDKKKGRKQFLISKILNHFLTMKKLGQSLKVKLKLKTRQQVMLVQHS